MHQSTIGKNDEWLTPKWILEPLGKFDLDPCSPVIRPWDTADFHYSERDDGLSKKWYGRVWCNPPFNRREKPKWMKRMSEHHNGILLIPANLETDVFQKYVWGESDGMCFLNTRPHFYYVTGRQAKANSGCTIVLVAYGKANFEILLNSGLGHCVREIKLKGND